MRSLTILTGASAGCLLAALLIAGCTSSPQSTAQKEPASAELDLCRRFMALKNAHDPAANDLLGPAPGVPTEAVPPEEADRLHAEFFLRGEYKAVSVRPETAEVSGPDARFILVIRGGVSSPRIPQTGPNGTDVISRTMSDPDIFVRVADGKILAVVGRLHHDVNEKPMSAEEQKRLLEIMQGKQRSGDER